MNEFYDINTLYNAIKRCCRIKYNLGDSFIINGTTTIFKKGDKTYVSKLSDGDRYDAEKGIMMCLLKAEGYTYSTIQDILKYAKKIVKKDKSQYVKVINWGKVYTSYNSWVKKYAPNYLTSYERSDYHHCIGNVFKIICIHPHERYYEGNLILACDVENNVILINEVGVEYVK